MNEGIEKEDEKVGEAVTVVRDVNDGFNEGETTWLKPPEGDGELPTKRLGRHDATYGFDG